MSRTNLLVDPSHAPRRLLAVALFVGLCGLVAPAFGPVALQAQEVLRTGDLDEDEKGFLQEVIFELRYTDLARQWINTRMESRPSRTARGDLDYYLADCLQVEGKVDEYAQLIAQLKDKYPTHPRSQQAGLQIIRASLARVLGQLVEASQTGDTAERKRLVQEAQKSFKAEVLNPTNTGIETLNAQVAATDDGDYKPIGGQRDEWEHFRIQAYKLYAERLPEESPEQKAAYQKMLEYATVFCDERYVNQLYLYEGQLFRAVALAAVGENEEAAGIFELLAEIEPDAPPPYPDPVVDFVREIRLRGMTEYAQTFNAAGEPEKVVALYDRVIQYPSEAFPYKKDPETPALMTFRVNAEIEEAIARVAGGDNPAKGLALFEELIARFTDEQFVDANPQLSGQLMVEVGKGVSRMLDLGVGGLPAEFYYRAGIGYKSRGRYDDALNAFKRAVRAAGPSDVAVEWKAKSSWEMAETHAILGRRLEAAVGYLLHLEHFRPLGKKNIPNAPKAAQNVFAYFDSFATASDAEDAYDELREIGKALFDEYGSGIAAEQSKMQRAYELEQRGEYANARRAYQDVQRQTKEDGVLVEVPFYYDAQVSAARCSYQESRAKADPALEAQALTELKSLAQDAKARNNAAGRAAALYQLGVVHWADGKGDAEKASEVLKPLGSEITGDSDPRRAGIYLWLQARASVGDTAGAQRCFDLLQTNFSGHINVAQAAIQMIDTYRRAGTEADLRQAASFVEIYLDHPEIEINEQPVPFLGELASYLLEGGNTQRALQVLSVAQAKVDETGDDALKMIIQFRFAQAANAEGKHQDAIDALTKLIDEFPEIQSGEVAEAPEIFFERGRAYLALYAQSPRAELLENARKDFEVAVAVLEQRVLSFKSNGKPAPPALDLAYWKGYLQLLKVYERQEQFDFVYGTIQDFRLRYGGKSFAPGALQDEFDRLEASVKTKLKK